MNPFWLSVKENILLDAKVQLSILLIAVLFIIWLRYFNENTSSSPNY